MRWLKHFLWALLLLIAASTAAVSTTDLRHPPAQPPVERAEPAPDFRPELDRISGEIEDERAALAATAESLNTSSAKVTLLLIGCFVIGVLLICILIAQVVLLYRSIEVVRADTVTRNRPRLVVRHVNLEVFEPNRLAKVHWVIENTGNSPATIVEARSTLQVLRRGGLSAMPEYDDRNHAGGGLTIEPGRMLPFVQFSREDVASGDYDAVYRRGTGTIFFFGYIMYIDDVASRRRVGFCRQYDQSSGRFVTVDDMNYEYAD